MNIKGTFCGICKEFTNEIPGSHKFVMCEKCITRQRKDYDKQRIQHFPNNTEERLTNLEKQLKELSTMCYTRKDLLKRDMKNLEEQQKEHLEFMINYLRDPIHTVELPTLKLKENPKELTFIEAYQAMLSGKKARPIGTKNIILYSKDKSCFYITDNKGYFIEWYATSSYMIPTVKWEIVE